MRRPDVRLHGTALWTSLRYLAAAVIVLAIAAPVCGQTVTPGPDGTVSIRASAVPLSSVLDAIGMVAPFEKLTVASELGSTPVTLDIPNATIRSALAALMDAAGADYALSSSPEGQRVRLTAKPSGGGKLRPAAAATSVPLQMTSKPGKAEKRSDEEDVASSPPPPVQSAEEGERLSQAAVADMTAILTAPPVPPRSDGVVELPFPGPDGAPMRVVVPPKAPVTRPAASAPLNIPAIPPDLEPGQRDLYEALLSARKPGG